MKRLLGLAGVLLGATVATAATWTCEGYSEFMTPDHTMVAAYCRATGTYTTGGDALGAGGTNVQLCHSANRHLRMALVSATSDQKGAATYVAAWEHSTSRITLATAASTPGPDKALAQVAAGAPLDGFTIRVLSFCD